MTYFRALLAMACFTLIVGCRTLDFPLTQNEVQKSVNLQVVENGTALNVTTPADKGCRGNNQVNGCVHVGYKKIGAVTFVLNAGPGWHFTSFKICKNSDKDNQDCSLTPWDRMEWAATDENFSGAVFPAANGDINLTDLSANLTKFIILDQNNFDQEWFYTIKACNSDASKCPDSDPPWENDGRGSY